jgi:PiT family inorganic phosphate transporter
MTDMATAVDTLPRGESLLDGKMKKTPAWISGLIVAVALLGGLGFIGFHVAEDMSNTVVRSAWPFVLLGVALLIALGFEFVNGFHDTANAVATVIYTHSLEPNVAVVWSGLCNLVGVLVSSGTVAFSIITLLPVELILKVSAGAGFAMVFALLLAAIIWNLSTWWLGLPASSSHTMVGSIIGVGIANQIMNSSSGTSGVDWTQAANVFRVLLISPLVGFICSALLFLVFKLFIKYPALYEAPKGNMPPPWPIRLLLVLTCSGVSYSHGSNDGQKGMGLIMLILIGTVPAAYALNHAINPNAVQDFVAVSARVDQILNDHIDPQGILGEDARAEVTEYLQTKQIRPDTVLALRELVNDLSHEVALYKAYKNVPADQQTNVRNDMYVSGEAIRLMLKAKKPKLRFHECGGVIDALPLELFQVCNVRLVVLSAGCDNNAARLDDAAIFQSKLVWALVASDLYHFLADHHLRTKFLCLHNRAVSKLLPRNAHWKANIVLDL